MSELRHANSFRELIVYQHAREVSRTVFQLSKSFPKEEMYSLTDQIRRCSRSVGAQIAEAWGKRRYERHFASKLTDADAEQLETQHWIDTALDCGYIKSIQAEDVNQKLSSIGRMLYSMIAKSEQFCGPAPEPGHR
jgi:four helix bundle protein